MLRKIIEQGNPQDQYRIRQQAEPFADLILTAQIHVQRLIVNHLECFPGREPNLIR